MALIDHKHRFIFFHLYKCAGNSTRRLLFNKEYCSEIGDGCCTPSDAKELMRRVGEIDKFNSYVKFTIVRNIYDWLVSIYFHIVHAEPHPFHKQVKRLSFKDFLSFYIDVMMKNHNIGLGDNKCVTPLGFIRANGIMLLDYIGRFEEIGKEIKHIQKKIGLREDPLPRININSHRDKDYRQYYDDESVGMVRKYFEEDLIYFNYEY